MADCYTIEKRDGRWWFITPEGTRFWYIGMNHIDSAALRYTDSDDVWNREFGNSPMNIGYAKSPMTCGIGALTRLAGPKRP